jgi:cell division transport system permease protein
MAPDMARELIPGRSEPETPSNTFSYFLREAVRRLWISKRNSFVAIAMIAISLMILGSFLLVAENLGRAVAQWQGKSRVNIYLDAEATPEQVHGVEVWLTAHPDFTHRHFVTKAEAMARFKRDFTNLTEIVGQIDENPFPASFECQVTPQVVQSRAFDRAISELRGISGVEQVQFDWQWVERLKRLVNLVNLVGLLVGGILAIAAAFTIANVIRLTMMLYREEIDIMRLVGATERIIRGPFLIEGILQGTIGGALAVLLLFTGFELARRMLAPSSSLLWGFLFNTFLPWQKIVALILGGTLAGWIGSWLSVRETTEESI